MSIISKYIRPLLNEYVTVVDNETMSVVAEGKLLSFTRDYIVVEHINRENYRMMFDARIHHFRGYEPPVMLVRRSGELVRKS